MSCLVGGGMVQLGRCHTRGRDGVTESRSLYETQAAMGEREVAIWAVSLLGRAHVAKLPGAPEAPEIRTDARGLRRGRAQSMAAATSNINVPWI